MSYHILFAPLIAGLLAQAIKIFCKNSNKKFKFKDLAAYSGMPSGHSAMIVSLAMIIALEEGIKSSLFSMSLILAIIVIRDALGIRRYLGEHGHVLNLLVKDLKDDDVLDVKYPHLLEKIGHTPLQVFAGALIGVLTSLIFFLLAS